DGGQPRGVLLVEDAGDQIGVADQVGQLGFDVAVVDVDRDGTDLDAAEHGGHPRLGVDRVDADVVAGPDTPGLQEVAEAVGPLVELGEGQPRVTADEGGAIRYRVDGVLEQVSDVVGHGGTLPSRCGAHRSVALRRPFDVEVRVVVTGAGALVMVGSSSATACLISSKATEVASAMSQMSGTRSVQPR